MHLPVQVPSQHTPSTHLSDAHWLAFEQTSPRSFLAMQLVPLQKYPVAQSPLPAHEPGQPAPAPSHSQPMQAPPCGAEPLVAGEHVPMAVESAQVSQAPVHALLQHTPSTQLKPVLQARQPVTLQSDPAARLQVLP
jgi:hypothetical protein